VGEYLGIKAARIQDCAYLVCKSLQIVVEGSNIVIIGWENLSGLWKEDPRLLIKAEDPRLRLFGVRISPDYGGRIQVCYYLVGESLWIVAGESKIVIIWCENLYGLSQENSRFSLFCGRISLGCGRRIQDSHYFVG
jgi:hypothetical protein